MMEPLFEEDDAPDFYVDSVRIAFGPYGFLLDLGLSGVADTPESEKPPTKRLALVRMSPQHALILAKLLARNVARYEEKLGEIKLPEEFYKELGLEPE